MEKTHKIDVVSIRLVEEPPLYSSKELKNPCTRFASSITSRYVSKCHSVGSARLILAASAFGFKELINTI